VSTPADLLITRLRLAWAALAVLAAGTIVIGWPRDVVCNVDSPSCPEDTTSGAWAAVSIGAFLAVVALGVFMVWASAVGTRLGNRADREAVSPTEAPAGS
jgi:hypothetical protein